MRYCVFVHLRYTIIVQRTERKRIMKKFYAIIFHSKSGANIEIGEYTESSIENSIKACIKQMGWNPSECSWHTRSVEI